MRDNIETMLDRLLLRRARARRRKRADITGHAPLAVEEGAEASGAAGTIRMPLLADWGWRPEIWREPVTPPGIEGIESGTAFGSEAKIFHDSARPEISILQIRNRAEPGPAPFGLRMDVAGFEGSFLSLALDLPDTAVAGLKRNHVIRVDISVEVERPIRIFARLNVRHGPNTEQLVRGLPLTSGEPMVEFDLAYSKMNEKRVEGAWVDLIFEAPEMNRIMLGDLTVCRRPRAEL